MMNTFKSEEVNQASNEDLTWMRHHPPPSFPPGPPTAPYPTSSIESCNMKRPALLPTPVFIPPINRATCLRRPDEYHPIMVDIHPFTHGQSHNIGHEKVFMCSEPLFYPLAKGKLVVCYVTELPSVGVWSLSKEDVMDLNSIIYDLAEELQLCGQIRYYSCNYQQHFKIDRRSKFYNARGRMTSWKSRSICGKPVEDLEAYIVLQIYGISLNTVTNVIDPIIAISSFAVKKHLMEGQETFYSPLLPMRQFATSSGNSTMNFPKIDYVDEGDNVDDANNDDNVIHYSLPSHYKL